MIPATYLPRPKFKLKRSPDNVIACELEQRPSIHLSASKTIVVLNQSTEFNLDLLLLYQTASL